jgi:cytochrome P450
MLEGYQVHVPYDTDGSLIDIIDPAAHSKRRRIWERAFTPNAIKSYEPMLQARLNQLMVNFVSRVGQPIDIAEWFGFFSLDFMGDFGFGGSFDFMARGADTDGFHKFIEQTSGVIEMAGMIPWIRPLLQRLPASKPKQFQQMALRVAEKRKEEGSQIRDLFHYLVRAIHSTIVHPYLIRFLAE